MTADEFREWYKSRNLTQDEVAGLLGIYRSRVSNMSRGKAPVSRQTARMLFMCEPLLGLATFSSCTTREAVRRLSEALDRAEVNDA
jgi:transcriptional regulator with XRE-family HTH domain